MASKLKLLSPVSLLLLVATVSFVSCKGGKKSEETKSFDVKPSGQIAHETLKLENGVTCIFTYAAVGGTNEEWSINLRRVKKHAYTCTIERPEQSSYLFFMSFAVSVIDHNVEAVEIFDNSGALLQDEEYIITEDLRSVKHKEGGFQSNLAKIVLTAKTPPKSGGREL